MNVKKGIIALLIFPLFIISMMPLSVHADDYTSSTIVGFNVNLINGETTTNQDNTVGYVYEIEWILDDNYVGTINLTFTVNSTNPFTSQARNYAVNGNSFKASFWSYDSTGNSSSQQRPSVANITYTVNSTNLTKLPNGIERWEYPMESFGIITSSLLNLEYIGINDIYEYKFPIFQLKNNDLLYHGSANNGQVLEFIFGINKDIWNAERFANYFSINNNYQFIEYRYIDNFFYGNEFFNILYVKIKMTNTSLYDIRFNDTDAIYMPIYYRDIKFNNINTDFALTFGLTNTLLDNIQQIADGTSASSSSVSSADQQNDTFKDQADDLISQEEEFTSDMKQNLQQIDTNFTFNNFGNKFMSSAVWVRDQYDHMITNTPFGTLVTFSLLLGLGLLIIGRTVNK